MYCSAALPNEERERTLAQLPPDTQQTLQQLLIAFSTKMLIAGYRIFG